MPGALQRLGLQKPRLICGVWDSWEPFRNSHSPQGQLRAWHAAGLHSADLIGASSNNESDVSFLSEIALTFVSEFPEFRCRATLGRYELCGGQT